MSSYEFLRDFINPARQQFNESPIRHNDFIAKIKDEIDEDLIYGNFVDSRNRDVSVIMLDFDSMISLGMRESKGVRKSIKARLKEIEQPRIPQSFSEALQLAADQAKQLELQAPKVAFVDKLVTRTNLMNATQIAQKHGKSAVWLNKYLDEKKVYNQSVKRVRTFNSWFVEKGFGEMKKSETGFDQALFTNAGEVWINEQLYSDGMV
jgi:phage antirepressor YoqD-like protein